MAKRSSCSTGHAGGVTFGHGYLRRYMAAPYRPPMTMDADESQAQRRDKVAAYRAANPNKPKCLSVRAQLAEMVRPKVQPGPSKPGLIERLTGAARRFFQRRMA